MVYPRARNAVAVLVAVAVAVRLRLRLRLRLRSTFQRTSTATSTAIAGFKRMELQQQPQLVQLLTATKVYREGVVSVVQFCELLTK